MKGIDYVNSTRKMLQSSIVVHAHEHLLYNSIHVILFEHVA